MCAHTQAAEFTCIWTHVEYWHPCSIVGCFFIHSNTKKEPFLGTNHYQPIVTTHVHARVHTHQHTDAMLFLEHLPPPVHPNSCSALKKEEEEKKNYACLCARVPAYTCKLWREKINSLHLKSMFPISWGNKKERSVEKRQRDGGGAEYNHAWQTHAEVSVNM